MLFSFRLLPAHGCGALLWVAGWLASAYSVQAEEPRLPRVLDERLVVELVAAEPDLVTPTGLTVLGPGRVLVVESHTHFPPAEYAGPKVDRLRLLIDDSGDSRAERVVTWYEGGTATMNVALHPDGSIWVAERSKISRLRDTDGDDRADEVVELLHLETEGNYPHDGLSGFAFDLAGNAYFGLGENLGADYRLVGSDGSSVSGGGEGGSVFRCDAKGGRLIRFATGYWNPFHVALDAFGRLWTVDNDPDSRPPCRLLHVVLEGDYGYRFRNGRKGLHPFTAWNGELPGTLPMTAGTGEAPSGVLLYDSDGLPDAYRGQAIVTSWGDHRLDAYALAPHGASYLGVRTTILSGDDHFRPVGVALAPDGSLYVSDWVDRSYELHGFGRVWRVRSKSAVEHARPDDPALALYSPHEPARQAAARALLASREGGLFILENAARTAEDPFVRANALSAVAMVNDRPALAAELLRHDSSPEVRMLAASHLPLEPGEPPADWEQLAAAERAAILRALQPSDLGRSDKAWLGTVLAETGDADPFVQQAAQRALARLWSAEEFVASSDAHVRLAALLALRAGEHNDDYVAAFLSDSDANVRQAAVQWAGERRVLSARGALEQMLAAEDTPPALFDGVLAALGFLNSDAPQGLDETGTQALVAQLVESDSTPPAVRARALRMLDPLQPVVTAELLNRFWRSGDRALAGEAVQTLRGSAIEGRAALLQALASSPEMPLEVRIQATLGLTPDDVDGRALLWEFALGDEPALRDEALRGLAGGQFSAEEQASLRELAKRSPECAELVQRALAEKPAAARPPLDDVDAWLQLVGDGGDAQAGERIFFHTRGVGCYRCHTVAGRGAHVGPDLTTLAAGLDRRRMLESILQPSKEVAPQFTAWNIQRSDGQLVAGVLVQEFVDGRQTYVDAQGRSFTLTPAEIDLRTPHDLSLMPAALVEQLTLEELRDLLAFLESRRGPADN